MPSVFLSYSHEDEAWKDRLKTHLGVLDLETWDDRRVEGGADWFEEIQVAMEKASVAVLLVSADFLTSKFILSKEIPQLLRHRSTKGLIVLPVIVRTCAWAEVKWLKGIQTRPLDGRALASFDGDRPDQELTKIAKEIRALLDREEEFEILLEDSFLDRVETVCRLREPEAEIRRYPGIGEAGGYLRVVRQVGDFRDIYPVGVLEHGLSQLGFEAFLTEIDAPYRKNDPGLISRLVYGGEPATPRLVTWARARRVHLVSFVEHQGLIDFRTYLSRQTGKLTQDPIYPASLYVPQRMRTLALLGQDKVETDDALAQVREWLDAPLGRFIVLLGDFGTGKTFLLQELARRMGEAEEGLIPVLLQMRSLEKGRSLDALLAQHFAQEGMDGFSPTKFRYMLEQGRIALLFDGFDELALRVTYAKAADHFSTLLQAASGNAKVVLTSRRQHFLSEHQIKTALTEEVEALSGHRLAILRPFRREQVRSFLVNFFTGDEAKAEARLALIDRVKDLLGLSANPRLLGFIADLPAEQLVEACDEGGEITAAKLYQLLLDRWLGFEFDRIHHKGAPPGLSVEERWQAVTLLAIRLWQKTDRFVELSDLSEEAARVVKAVGPANATPNSDAAAFQVGSGTLLVRDDEGHFAFLHQSILEWLVAKNAAEELQLKGTSEALAVREISPLMADFFASLAGKEPAVAWARRSLASPASEAAKKNSLLVLERQKEKIKGRVDLAALDLRGKDLSGHDLSGADLRGADLTAARLCKTRLTSARLNKATLRDADLSQAILDGADLTDADLTGARLLGADLRGALLTATRLKRTRLLGASLDANSIETADIFGSATNLSELGPQNGTAGQGPFQSVAWSPDGDLLAGAAGAVIRLWEGQSGREIRVFAGHKGSVQSVAISPDGKNLASGSYDNTVRLWQIDNGREIRKLTGHQNWVRSVAFSPDGKTLASGSYDSIRLWQIDNGRNIRVMRVHEFPVQSLAFSPDGRSLASSSYDRTIRLWQFDSGQEIRKFIGHQSMVRCVTFSPDGKTLASSSDDTTVRLWQADSGQEIRKFTGHQSIVRCAAFSPNGKTLAGGSQDDTVRLWQVDSGQNIRKFTGHQDTVLGVAFNPDGKTLASGSPDTTVRLWQVDTGQEIRKFTEHKHKVIVQWVAFNPDGKTLASGSSDTTVRLWRVDSGREIRTFTGHKSAVTSVAFSPDGKTLASSSDSIRLWQVDNGRVIRASTGGKDMVRGVTFSPDGKSLASYYGHPYTVHLWQADSGREIRAFTGHGSSVNSVAFSPDGKSLSTGSDDRTVRLWHVNSGKEVKSFTGHQKRVLSVAFSPDGKTIASGSEDKTVRLWRVDSGREIGAFTNHEDTVWSVAFSPDGRTLASGSADNSARLWQVDSGQEIRALTGHQISINSMSFLPHGNSPLSKGASETRIRLWQAATGEEIRALTEHQDTVRSVAFSPDGKSLASSSDDGTIRLWDVADGRCLAVLLSLPEGWVAYSPDGRYKFGGVPAGGFWHAINLCRFEIGELDELVPGLRLPDEASFFDLPPWKPELRALPG